MPGTNSAPASFEVLLVDEYAERLKVGKSTIFYWKDKGVLKPGKHYFQTGKVLRFIWDLNAILELHYMPEQEKKEAENQEEPEGREWEETGDELKPPKQPVGINLDY